MPRKLQGSNVKLAYLIANFPTISETFVSNEIARLKALGQDVTIYAFGRTPPADRDKLTDAARELAAQTHYISKQDALLAGLTHPLQLIRLLPANVRMQAASTGKPQSLMRLLRAVKLAALMHRADIDHLHAHWPYATEVAWLVHRLTGIPYSVSIHAHEVAHENGHFPLVFPSLSFATFCNRSAMEHLLSQLSPDARAKSHLVYHGVDISDFVQLPFPASSDPLRVVSAGRLTRTKGFDRLICGCALARERGINVELAILGRGAEEAHLREVAASCGFEKYLELPGWVSHSKVQDYLARAHVFALLADTTFHDGLPNVVLEAMASGRPVIISPLPAAGEAVENDREGFILTAPDDLEGFTAALGKLHNASDRAASMADSARTRVVADHDAGLQISRLRDLLTQRQPAANT